MMTPLVYDVTLVFFVTIVGAEADTNKIEILTEESLLEMIERAFPNGLAFKDIAKYVMACEYVPRGCDGFGVTPPFQCESLI